jgi:high affinity sulfate transporter 1
MPAPAIAGAGRWLPGLWVLRHYRREWLWPDIVAGLVLTALLVPAGMGYAEASGLPAITGLYATVVPLIAYALAGPSRILVLGPDSALAALVLATVAPLAGGSEERAVALAAMLGVMTGGLCVAAGLAKLGFLTDLLSKPVRVGYMNGIALTIVVSQAPKLCGISVSAPDVPHAALAFVRSVGEGRVKTPALVVGAACLAIILGSKAVSRKIPGVLIAVVAGTVAVAALGLSIPVVGAVPRGFPMPSLPVVRASDLGPLLSGAAGIALVAFADTSVLSRTFAVRAGLRVDPNRELVGLGVANIAAGLFRGFPISSSSSRTPVAQAAGSKTQLTGVVGALAITALLVAAPDLVRNMPVAALAAVVIAAAIGLVDVKSVRVFARVRGSDFFVTVFCFLAVTVFGVITGIALSVGISLLDFVRRAWRPHDAILGRAAGVKGYHDITRYPAAKQVPGLLLYRWDAPLFFANADQFRARIVELVDAAEGVKWVVVAAEPITDVDTTAAEMIEELDAELQKRGVNLAFAELKDPVRDRLVRYELAQKIGMTSFYPTLGVAVKAFLDQHPVPWVDWEEAAPRSE